MSEANLAGNAGSATPASRGPNHLRRAVILWVVLSIVGVVIWLIVGPSIFPGGETASESFDDSTLVLFTALAIPVALFVYVFVAYSLSNFKASGRSVGQRTTEYGAPLHPTPGLQISWLAITGGLCLFLIIWGLFGYYEETTTTVNNPLVVQVTGQQWMWTFNYPQYGATTQGAQVLELPVNRPVVFSVTSKDVLHGFSIFGLGVRVDANPGQITTTAQFTPTAVGSYRVVCVEMCGLYHSYMWEEVKVVPATGSGGFSDWIVSQGGHL